jgi:hypothetical protein
MNHFQRVREILPQLGREASQEEREAREELVKAINKVVSDAVEYGRIVMQKEMEDRVIEGCNTLMQSLCPGRVILGAYDLRE